MEPFTLIEHDLDRVPYNGYRLFNDVRKLSSGLTADHDLQYGDLLRKHHPDMVLTTIPLFNANLRAFAAMGFATYELDTEHDTFASWRGYVAPVGRTKSGTLGENIHFAKYKYTWANEHFIVYLVGSIQYVLAGRKDNEGIYGPSRVTDALILAVGNYSVDDVVWVFDGYWYTDKNLYRQVMKSSWGKVILDEDMKKDLVEVASDFFASEADYDDLGVPWRRGLLFHGPPGNGKTISIKALMHTLLDMKPAIPTLYVKSAPNIFTINAVFRQARAMSPCMLVLEDIETIVTPMTRSYFFNQLDGIEDNRGLFVVASTNFLDKLDPGLTKRPSRFDRKYFFALPNEHERTLYAQFWRHKLADKPEVDFPSRLCPAMAHVTPGFSFAFMQECFIATLLEVARRRGKVEPKRRALDDPTDDLDQYELWRIFKAQARILKKQLETQSDVASTESHLTGAWESEAPTPEQTEARSGMQPPIVHQLPLRPVPAGLPSSHNQDGYLPPLNVRKVARINSAAFMEQ